jgi:hypothetical protein
MRNGRTGSVKPGEKQRTSTNLELRIPELRSATQMSWRLSGSLASDGTARTSATATAARNREEQDRAIIAHCWLHFPLRLSCPEMAAAAGLAGCRSALETYIVVKE